MFLPFWDPTMILLIPAIILAAYAQAKVQSTYTKFSRVPSASGRTGREIAQSILAANGIPDVVVEPGQGVLSDHYDPIHKTVRLSPQNYEESSIAAISVAAHECGHAIQHAHGYVPLQIRTGIFPLANIGTNLAWIFIIAGFIFANRLAVFGVGLLDIGIFLFTFGVIFQLITLPVEFDASRRALVQLNRLGLVAPDEQRNAKKVLDAAALTYVAAAAVAVLELVRLLLIRDRR
ncbi:MAG: zinc metallopeptidase [Candidatus Eisenbacteria bacterium]|uniref:Zinc metallopeptidase n=1 Tax=Eiseniibacteriota bacterium TaxID=2212470 RepID=A0A538SXR5_UNCEI|nr:MAG: zinc metallopeptidase [Candidatus Eisenbacteria bacterium]TMQ66551.1 MAG: zinc metallopeptidase [Candidatus Eisenbacteria bacterium]